MLGTCTIRKSVLYVCVFQTPAFPLFDIKKMNLFTCVRQTQLSSWKMSFTTVYCTLCIYQNFLGVIDCLHSGKVSHVFQGWRKTSECKMARPFLFHMTLPPSCTMEGTVPKMTNA